MSVAGDPEVRVCGRFAVLVGARELVLPTHAQRLLAYLSIDRRIGTGHRRSDVAERLWPYVLLTKSQGSLRTALWRLRQADPRLIDTQADSIRLGEAVTVDLHRMLARAKHLLTDDDSAALLNIEVDSLRGDLLVGWEEDWLLLERERTRHAQIHALEALSRRLQRAGQHAGAIDAALAAVAAEPLREAAQATLIAAYLADRDHAAAHCQLRSFTDLLNRELGARPSRELLQLVERQP